ncbi:unnamed protein product [Discosporangium mesarthrocarpum]
MAIGGLLVAFVGATYLYTINKMKSQDFLAEVEQEAAEEAQIHLHKSGLKVSNKIIPEGSPGLDSSLKGVDRSSPSPAVAKLESEAAEAVVEAVEAVADAAEKSEQAGVAIEAALVAAVAEKLEGEGGEGAPKKKGWRRWLFFGPRREG